MAGQLTPMRADATPPADYRGPTEEILLNLDNVEPCQIAGCIDTFQIDVSYAARHTPSIDQRVGYVQ